MEKLVSVIENASAYALVACLKQAKKNKCYKIATLKTLFLIFLFLNLKKNKTPAPRMARSDQKCGVKKLSCNVPAVYEVGGGI